MTDVPKHPQASLYPGEVVTLACMFALTGVGHRPCYRWLVRDWRDGFPRLPERTRLFRLFKTHRPWIARFLAEPTRLGVIATYGMECIHAMREGRSPSQTGKKGDSNHRGIVGGKWCLLVNPFGWVVAWACATATV